MSVRERKRKGDRERKERDKKKERERYRKRKRERKREEKQRDRQTNRPILQVELENFKILVLFELSTKIRLQFLFVRDAGDDGQLNADDCGCL